MTSQEENKIGQLFDKMNEMATMRDYALLFFRAWAAKVFYMSGRSKVGDGFFSPSDLTVTLFEDEYALPILPADTAAQLAVYAETFFPIMLMIGLGTRFGAAGLLGMTLVIQFLVYPGYFPEHFTWFAALLPLMMLGGGKLSIDHLVTKKSV